jgi:tetrahydromethanopterin S-methyltransferase subunit F
MVRPCEGCGRKYRSYEDLMTHRCYGPYGGVVVAIGSGLIIGLLTALLLELVVGP